MTSECIWASGSLTLDDVFGSFAGYNLGIGNGNTLMGYESGYDMTSGINNSCYGIGSGSHLSTGNNNTCLGYYAGGGGTYPLTTESQNTFLGYNAGTTLDSVENSVAIGTNSNVSASNTIALGGDELIEGSPATAVVINGQSADAQLQVNMADGATIGIIANGHSDVECHLQEWQVAGTALGFIDQAANLSLDGGATIGGTLTPNGAVAPAYVTATVTPATTLTATGPSIVECDTNLGAFTVNLPDSGLIAGQTFTILDTYGSAPTNAITIKGNGNLINNMTSVGISNAYGCKVVRWCSTTSQWTIVSEV